MSTQAQPAPLESSALPSRDALRASIAEHRAGAREQELDNFTRATFDERQRLVQEAGFLRQYAYQAQSSAAHHRKAVDAARRDLAAQAASQQGLCQALQAVRSELAAERQAHAALSQVEGRDAAELARATGLHARETKDLRERLAYEEGRRQECERRTVDTERHLAAAREECAAEARVAREWMRRAEEAEAAHNTSRRTHEAHNDHAARTLHETVTRLEADFEAERKEHRARDKRHLVRLEELEHALKEAETGRRAQPERVDGAQTTPPRLADSPSQLHRKTSSVAKGAMTRPSHSHENPFEAIGVIPPTEKGPLANLRVSDSAMAHHRSLSPMATLRPGAMVPSVALVPSAALA